MAQEALNADGILIHMLLGNEGGYSADVRDASIRKMVKASRPNRDDHRVRV